MLLQKGKFLVKDITDLEQISPEDDGIKRVISLTYMGKAEYEGNAIPISRMFIEYNRERYFFYPVEIYSKNHERMYIFANSDLVNEEMAENPNYILDLARYLISRNVSLWDYINHEPDEDRDDFWWNINGDYFIFFGESKIDIINYFINSCFERDGKKDEIKRKLALVGYNI